MHKIELYKLLVDCFMEDTRNSVTSVDQNLSCHSLLRNRLFDTS